MVLESSNLVEFRGTFDFGQMMTIQVNFMTNS